MKNVSLRDILTSMMQTIDLVSFFVKNHHKRVSCICYKLSLELNWPEEKIIRTVVAASMHDVGAISIKERQDLIQVDVINPEPHAKLGAQMLRDFDCFIPVSNIIRYHHHKWDEGRSADSGTEIPDESYLLHLADRIDILTDPDLWILDQTDTIKEKINAMSGEVFKPEFVEAFNALSQIENFWFETQETSLEQLLKIVLPDSKDILMDCDRLEDLAYTFSRIIDFRSPYTTTHSLGVAAVAEELGRLSGKPGLTCRKLRIAGFLHDLGKAAIPTEILEKDSKLDHSEFNRIKAHAYYTHSILNKIPEISDICNWASYHHEKPNGSGYPFKINKENLSEEVSIIALSDVFTALSENRTYRKAMDSDQIKNLMMNMVQKGELNPDLTEILMKNYDQVSGITAGLQKLILDERAN